MVSKKRTVTVPVPDAYDYLEPDEMDVVVTAFGSKIYVDYPDFKAAERRIQKILDTGDEKNYVFSPNPSECDTREKAIEYAKESRGLDENGLPSRKSQYCLSLSVVAKNADKLPDDLRKRVKETEKGSVALCLDLGEYFVRRGEILSNRSGEYFPIPEWGRPTGSYVATVAASESGKCPECGASKKEHWELVSSSRRTTVPNKYKCNACGYRKSGITTG